MKAVESLLNSGASFTAIFAANDQMAFGAALALDRHGLHVPVDVSLVGFDDLAAAAYSIPPLSTIHQPSVELGRLAAAAMLQLLVGKKPTIVMPSPSLVARSSSRALA